MEKKTRVCCFCEKWESGGIESLLFNVFSHIDLSHFEVEIVAAELSDSIFTEPLRARGVSFCELSGSQRAVFENWRRFWRLLRERGYDVVYLNVFQGLSLRYAGMAQKAGVPKIIAHSHNTALRKTATRAIKILIHHVSSQLWAGCATHRWACSRAAAEFLYPARLLRDHGYTFIPNGIETERFRFSREGRESARRELGITGQFVVGNVGRLCQQKNQTFLLEVFAALHRAKPDSKLLLVGNGGTWSELKAKAERLGITDSVIFYGTTNHVERLLWAMDAFAFPSLFEGLGIVILEAQVAGLPVICSERIPEEAVILNERVYRNSLSDPPEAWANRLQKTGCVERELSDVQASRTERFDIHAVAQLVESALRSSHSETADA